MTVGAPRGRACLASLLLFPLAAAAADSVPPRDDLERFEWALDRAVRKVSRPSASPVLGGAEACRGYHLNGYGALFVLAPRAFPVGSRSARKVRPARAVASPPALPARLEADLPKTREAARGASAREELLALESQVAALQREAEKAREEAELAIEETTRELNRRLVSSTLGTPEALGPIPPVPGAPSETVAPGPLPPPPLPPWRFWFEGEEPEDARTPERLIGEVRSAVTEVLEAQGGRLRLAPEEFVVVVVDFLPRGAFASRTRPARTLVVRVRKKELEERGAGRLASEELRKRIEYSEY
jgi:hypothetical protein